MKSIFRTLLLFLTANFYFISAFAQGPLRVEVEAKRNSDNYHIVPMGKNGILLFYESSERSNDGSRVWVFTGYNTDFKEMWSEELPVKNGLEYIDFVSDKDQKIYLLLGNHSTWMNAQGISKGNYQIVSVEASGGALHSINGRIPSESILDHFDVVDNYAYLSGIAVPSKATTTFSSCLWVVPVPCISYLIFAPMIFTAHPQVYQVDLKTGIAGVVNKKLKGMGFVVGTGSSEKDNTEDVIIRNEPSRKISEVLCYSYEAGGGLKNTIEIKGDNTKIINRANLLKLSPDEDVIIGTYSNPAVKRNFFSNFGPNRISNGYNAISNGLFFSKTGNGQTLFIKYYDFSKFESFYQYLNQVYGNTPRANKRKKEINQVNYYLLIHDIIKQEKQYIMVAEAYRPEYEYRYEQVYVPGTGTMPGHYETRRVTVFVGYRYTHAIVAGFDLDGNKFWDNTFEIENILTFDLKERVKVLASGLNVILAYSYGGDIETKVIQGNQVVQGKFSTPIETSHRGDKVLADYSSDMAYWYDNYFVTYGYERIKNTEEKTKSGKSRRTVFYFNKIAFQ